MKDLPAPIVPGVWLRQIFTAKEAAEGGIVRRKVRDVDRIIGRSTFEAELRRRGFHAVENAGQFVIFCNQSPVRVLC
ncbi:N-(5'-phosphoribosyl)anthranilate isomerase [Acidimangrovimonas sediminis]|uniref:N-(5'-phosphoribosyl)anthranilate isomerase n=1 Tax=Acidimangrovimonas sediminis TaxID=2056283 RepID=UPI000C80B82A|nr:N-(5'-phosphoribosyl)anthranilate isomerase [Acidimangrovimonas sediminis]